MKPENQLPKETDVVIIGAGIGGLISGIALARNGINAVIVEQHSLPGGYCSSFKRQGFNFDSVGIHTFGPINNNYTIAGNFIKKLNLDIHLIPLNPLERLFFPKKTIEIDSNESIFIEYLSKLFPNEKGINSFFKETKSIARNLFKYDNKKIDFYKHKSFMDMLNLFFKDKSLKSIIANMCIPTGAEPKKASSIALSIFISTYYSNGSCYPKGGNGHFSEVLTNKFIALGGKILVAHEATKIIIDNGTATGIVFRNKTNLTSIIKCKSVISNTDAKDTFFRLVGKENLEDSFINNLSSRRISNSPFIVYLGVKIETTQLVDKCGAYFSSLSFNDFLFYLHIPTLLDPSLAPNGHHIIQIITIAPKEMIKKEITKIMKREHTDKLISEVEKYIPDLRKHIIVKDSASPETLYRYTLNSNGSGEGWHTTLIDEWNSPFNCVTPIKNLYLAGHWTTPGQGINSVIISALNTTNIIKKNLIKTNN